MVFLMLRDVLGNETFDLGLRRFWHDYRFKIASWRELEESFAAVSGRRLSAFFAQWLEREGAPAVRIVAAERTASGARVTLDQDEPAYSLRVPLVFRSAQGEEAKQVELTKTSETFDFALRARPDEVVLDPELRLFRRLSDKEAPPILRQLIVNPSTRTVVLDMPLAAMETAKRLAASLQDASPRFQSGSAPLSTDAPLLVIGLDEQVEGWLAAHKMPAQPPALRGRGTATVWTVLAPQGNTIAVVAAKDADALAALIRPLPHYGRASYLAFDGAKLIERGVWPSQPQVWRLQ